VRSLARGIEPGSLLQAFDYALVSEDQDYTSLRPLTDWLSYNGFTVVTKAMKEFTDASGRRKVKGDMNVKLAVDVMKLASQIHEMVLFSGDGAFRRLSRQFSAAVSALPRFQRHRHSRKLPTNCDVRQMSSRTSRF
jgi:uncharacterized LabA/DUF88 family protein